MQTISNKNLPAVTLRLNPHLRRERDAREHQWLLTLSQTRYLWVTG